jgi:lipoate-protein ligase B
MKSSGCPDWFFIVLVILVIINVVAVFVSLLEQHVIAALAYLAVAGALSRAAVWLYDE